MACTIIEQCDLLLSGGVLSEAQPQVLIIILNWNGAAATLAAVASLSHLQYRNWRLLIIDNGSHDGSLELLRPLVSKTIEVIGLATNAGYTGGCNLGLRHAMQLGAKYAWLLNSDAITEPHTLSALVALAESDPRIGLVAPLIASLDDPSEIVIAGAIWDEERRQYADTHDVAVAKRWLIEYPHSCVVHGTAMLVNMQLVKAIGLLDHTLFAYYEDIDYSLRSLAAGYRNVVTYSTRILHDNKNMYKRPEEIKMHYWYYMARNEMLVWRKCLGLLRSLRVLWWIMARFMTLRSRCGETSDAGAAILAGLWHGWANQGGPYLPSKKTPALIIVLAKLYQRLFRARLSAGASPSSASVVKN